MINAKLKKARQQLGGQTPAPTKGGPPAPTTPPAKVPPPAPPLPAQPKKAQVRKPRPSQDPKVAAGKKNPPAQAPVNKGKKNPAKDTGATSVNPVEGEEEPSEEGESDADALSHLPTDEDSELRMKGQEK